MSRIAADTQFGVRQLATFLPYLKNQAGRLAAAYSTSLIGVMLALSVPWPLKFMIDNVLMDSGQLPIVGTLPARTQVFVLAVSMAVLASLASLTQAADKILHAKVRERFSLQLRDDLVQKLYRLSRERRQAEMSGELTMRLVGDTHLVSRMFCKTIPLAMKHLVTALMALVYLFAISLPIGAASLVMAVILGSLVFKYGPLLARAALEKRNQEGRVSAHTQETVNGLEHIQAMALEDQSRQRYLKNAAASLEAGVNEVRMAVSLERSSQIVAGISLALVAGIGGMVVTQGQLSLGALTVCLAYLAQLLKPIEKINEIATTISRGIARARRIRELFDAARTSVSRSGVALGEMVAEIECRGLTFRYADNKLPTVSGFDHSFRRGECTSLVGPSGCGKSTLLRIILGMQTPSAGSISANGVRYCALDARTLRAQFAVLLQDAHLFAGSIRGIVAEVNPAATDDMILSVLHDVHLWHVIDRLPQGLDTRIDEAGTRFSVGQRARLLLARALLSQRPVLLLDEPFANLDDESRRIIVRCLADAKKDRILIVVTHEQALLDVADHVLTPAEFQSAQETSATEPEGSLSNSCEVHHANAVA